MKKEKNFENHEKIHLLLHKEYRRSIVQQYLKQQNSSREPKLSNKLNVFSFTVSFDFELILDRDPSLATWVLSNFPLFLKVLHSGVYNVLERWASSESASLPKGMTKDTIYCFPEIKSFPYYETPITDMFYKLNIVNSKKGNLVWIKEACVIRVHKPEYYLWVQSFEPTCSCRSEKCKEIFKHHSFAKMLKNNFSNIKENTRAKLKKCPECSKFYREKSDERVYMGCQKLDVVLKNIETFQGLKEDRAFITRNKVLTLWLTKENINTVENFSSFSALCFFDINVEYSLDNDGRMTGIMNEFIIAYSIQNIQPVLNNSYFLEFFSKLKLAKYSEQENMSSDEFGEGVIYSNFMLLCDAAKLICLETLPEEELLILKLALLFSLLLKNKESISYIKERNTQGQNQPSRATPTLKKTKNTSNFMPPPDHAPNETSNLNIFVLTEDSNLIIRAIMEFAQGLENFHVFPYSFDIQSLTEFLLKMHKCILLIADPERLKKPELELLSMILRRQKIKKDPKSIEEGLIVDCCLWVVANVEQPMKGKGKNKKRIIDISDTWKNSSYDCFDIVLDVTRKNNQEKSFYNFFDFFYCPFFTEKFFFQYFTEDFFKKKRVTNCVQNRRTDMDQRKIHVDFEQKVPGPSQLTFSQSQISLYSMKKGRLKWSEEGFDKNKNAGRFLNLYFISVRKYKKFSLSNFASLRKIALGASLLRRMINTYGKNDKASEFSSNYIDISDAIVAILFDEETSLNKYGPQQVIFGGKGSKLFLNNFWDSELFLEGQGNSSKSENSKKTRGEKMKDCFIDLYMGIVGVAFEGANKNREI